MKAKYIGDPNLPKGEMPEDIEMFGVRFERGKFAEVPDDKADKFRTNQHFEVQETK